MRLLITAMGEDGRSFLASAADAEPQAIPGMDAVRVAPLYRTTEAPPPARQPSPAEHVNVQLAPGLLRWNVVEHLPHPPDGETHSSVMHTTDAVDLVYVISGAGDLLLDDGAHPIAAGDCVVMAGVPHGMRAGADGCRVLATSLGTPSID